MTRGVNGRIELGKATAAPGHTRFQKMRRRDLTVVKEIAKPFEHGAVAETVAVVHEALVVAMLAKEVLT